MVARLRLTANVSTGGDSVDVTDEIDDGFNQIAVRTLRAIPGLEHGACDVLARDITKPPGPGNYVVSEVEFDPAMSMHHFPARGRPRNVARAILLHYLARSRVTAEHGSRC